MKKKCLKLRWKLDVGNMGHLQRIKSASRRTDFFVSLANFSLNHMTYHSMYNWYSAFLFGSWSFGEYHTSNSHCILSILVFLRTPTLMDGIWLKLTRSSQDSSGAPTKMFCSRHHLPTPETTLPTFKALANIPRSSLDLLYPPCLSIK